MFDPAQFDPRQRAALESKLLRLADDEFILGHRNSEWTGHGPILEEDIAFSNLALDEIGHGILWYRIVATLRGEDPETFPDKLVYERNARDFRNVDVVALPHTDWAFSMLRQFLFDAYEAVHVPALLPSNYRPIAEAAAKIKQEEVYHLYHTRTWVRRLGLGTDESRRRMQTALDQLWTPFQQLFGPGPDESLLAEAGITAALHLVHDEWRKMVVPFLEASALVVPGDAVVPEMRQSAGPEQMGALIAELQEVSRIAPGAVW
jgi:ring-1,2-phenylacetyl-CoA epoxidase subunit PaaC